MADSGGESLIFRFALFVFIGGMFALAMAVFYFRRRARQRAWSELASRIGLTFEPGNLLRPARVTGIYRGRSLTLDTFQRGSGKSSRTYTRIVLSVNNVSGLRLIIYEEGILGKIGKTFGMQDIQVGDSALDSRFIIEGQPEDVIPNLFLAGGLSYKLLEARSVNARVDGHELRYEKSGVELDVDQLVFLFDLLCDLAEAVERVGGSFSFGSTKSWTVD